MKLPICSSTTLAAILLAGMLGLSACREEAATTPPTATPTAPPPPVLPQELEHVPPPDPQDPGRAVPDETVPERPIVEHEGPGAPGTVPGPTVP